MILILYIINILKKINNNIFSLDRYTDYHEIVKFNKNILDNIKFNKIY